ncbi:MAG: preprotein translocase subunit Sec61beta [Thermoplasmata archaeon]
MPEGKNRGFSSAAGLIQYYDMEETRAVKIHPWIVIALGFAVGVLVLVLNWRLT